MARPELLGVGPIADLTLGRLGNELIDAGSLGDDYALFGSTVMALHGLRPLGGDIDLFVTLDRYRALRDRAATRIMDGWCELEPVRGDPPYLELHVDAGRPAHVFYAWSQRDAWVCASHCLRVAEYVRGWRCVPLWMVAQHKRQALVTFRNNGVAVEGTPLEKHVRDLALLEAA